jgi:hypothetical protein
MQPASVQKKYNPFEASDWAVTPEALTAYNEIFDSLNPVNGSVSGTIQNYFSSYFYRKCGA